MKLIEGFDSNYRYILVAARRARQLQSGAPPVVQTNSRKPCRIAQDEIRAGKVKGFGVSSAQRSPLAPDLPTMAEEGVAGYELTAWFAAFVPAKTPKPIIDDLNAAMNAAIADKTVQDALLSAGIEPLTGTPDELRAFVVSETKKWADIVKAAGIQPE